VKDRAGVTILTGILVSVNSFFFSSHGNFTWMGSKILERCIANGLLFVTSGPTPVLFSDGLELCLRAFKPFGGFLQRIIADRIIAGFSR